MYILIETITGQSTTCNEDSIEGIMNHIQSQMGIPIDEQTLLFNGKKLEMGKSLNEFSLVENSKINLIISLKGGAKGKKKKKETKKTKKKHVHKKVKLAILKYYKIEGDKVIRLKQMCKVCPPGTFLAEHADRLYCGRCRTAYTKVVDNKGKGGKGEKGGKKERGKKK
jgi:small subunit ribosomal protein S27Ae